MRHEDIEPLAIGEESTEQKVRPKPQLNHLLPAFKLRSTDNEDISPWDYKGIKNLVMLFFDPRRSTDLETLAELRSRYHDIADDNGEVLAIASGPFDELKQCIGTIDIPFPLLSDADDRVRRQYGVTGPSVFVADKFGELKLQSTVAPDVDSTLNAALAVLDLSELECPECGVSTWPQD